MENGVSDGRSGAHDAQFADPLGPESTRHRVLLGHQNHLDRRDISVNWDAVVHEIAGDERTEVPVDDAFLEERHPDATDNTADELAPCGKWIDDAAGSEGGDVA